jgi:hypothetical protein
MMTGFQVFLTVFLGILFWIFTSIVANKVYEKLGWRNATETPLVAIWPLVILFWVFIGFPVMGFCWSLNRVTRVSKRVKTRTVREVK